MKVRAFCELPAGLAAVSLRLHGGAYCRPPISRMGNKQGYGETILAALGLRSGQGAGAYVWAEADADVRALLRAYPDPQMLRRIADIIRGWKDEEPRALWERLRAERKARGPIGDDAGAAGWVYVQGRSIMGVYGAGFVETEDTGGKARGLRPDNFSDGCQRLAEYAQVVASNRLIPGAFTPEGEWVNTGIGGATFGGEAFATPAVDVAGAFERVAGWIQESVWSYRQGDVESGGPVLPGDRRQDTTATATATARLAGGSRWPPVAVLAALPTAAELSAMLGTPGDLEGVVVYSDPDYRDTTGYLATCRDLIPDLARGWDAAGATVCISEAEPLPELAGWYSADITAGRRGQKRTFSKQQREVLTMNREPAHRVATQVSMFGGQ